MTHGHELKGGMQVGGGVQREIKGRKWDNCNIIMNKIFFIKKKKSVPQLY